MKDFPAGGKKYLILYLATSAMAGGAAAVVTWRTGNMMATIADGTGVLWGFTVPPFDDYSLYILHGDC